MSFCRNVVFQVLSATSLDIRSSIESNDVKNLASRRIQELITYRRNPAMAIPAIAANIIFFVMPIYPTFRFSLAISNIFHSQNAAVVLFAVS